MRRLKNMGKHKNKEQEKVFVNFMAKNPALIKKIQKEKSRGEIEELWENLTFLLNDAGPPIKNTSRWKKVWSDWKTYIRKKLARNKFEAQRTIGKPSNILPISPVEHQIARLCSLCDTVNEIQGERPFDSNSFEYDETQLKSRQTPSTSTSGSDPIIFNEETNISTSLLKNDLGLVSPSQSLISLDKKDITGKKSDDVVLKDYIKSQIPSMDKLTQSVEKLTEISKENRNSLKRSCYAIEELVSLKKEKLKETRRHNKVLEQLLLEKVKIQRHLLEIEKKKVTKKEL